MQLGLARHNLEEQRGRKLCFVLAAGPARAYLEGPMESGEVRKDAPQPGFSERLGGEGGAGLQPPPCPALPYPVNPGATPQGTGP